MDVGTLPNHVKSGVLWLRGDFSFNYLLVVDLLRFRFRYWIFNSVFLCCSIGDRSSTISIRAMDSKMTTTTKFQVEKFDGKSNFLLWKMWITSLLVKGGHTQGLTWYWEKTTKDGGWWVKRHRLLRKGDDHTVSIRWGPLQRDERGDNCWFFV